ncbi:MAG: hypothetical protein ACM3ZQ_08530 [Bacillota bacterium]
MKEVERFWTWAYVQRATLMRKMAAGSSIGGPNFFLDFCRHTPTMITNGPAGINGAIKGVGFLLQDDYLEAAVDDLMAHIERGWHDGYSDEGLQLLVRHLWGEGCASHIDPHYLTSIELACKHSYANVMADPQVTLVYYQPPAVSFELRGTAQLINSGRVHTFVNAVHDAYHRPNLSRWTERPVYLMRVEEIYDNSVGRDAFGRRIYPLY